MYATPSNSTVNDSIYNTYKTCEVRRKVGFLYSAAYTITGPARFTISEVAADRQELMMLQRNMRPSIARANGKLDPRCS